jgi:hypothetical protein
MLGETVVWRMMFMMQILIKGKFDCNCVDCLVIWMLVFLMSGSILKPFVFPSLLADKMKWSSFVASN